MDLLEINDRAGEYPPSYYRASANLLQDFPPLKGDHTCDVCVVGGGYTGLSSALYLAQAGYEVILLDAQRVGFGASGRNGGQVGSGQRMEQAELEKSLGRERARALWLMAEESKSSVRELIEKHNIECAYKPGIMHAEFRKKDIYHTKAYVEKLRDDYNYNQIEFLDGDQVQEALGSNAYCAGSMDWGAGHLHPLNFALGLARACREAGVRIFEQSRVTKIKRGDPVIATTAKGSVKARFLVLGANGYLGDLVPEVAARVMPINNFIIATEPLGSERASQLIRDDIAVADSRFVVNYFRLSEDRRMLFGGGESYGYRFPENIVKKAQRPMLEIFPQLKNARIDYAWGGTLAVTMNRMADFRRLGGNIFSASGYSGHGVALAVLAGKLMAEAIGGTAERFDVMADVPIRRFPGGPMMRLPLLVLAMTWYSLRDRL
ncbi:Oxidoreductase [hydrothermal vent metagenome]|uniref:Oxidoreductase n=1 Tax=hydrothermal vent metagenome TaxID=652676 RepID=A0A3B0TED0_9ZZZZ